MKSVMIRSPFKRVKILLLSKTVFKLSIQKVSTGPSRIIHFSVLVVSLQISYIILARTPVNHSPVLASTYPNNSAKDNDFGLIS
jgi:hypothetical protein